MLNARWVALLHVGGWASAQLYIPDSLGCDSEGELLQNLEWLRDACTGEDFPDARTPVPSAISSQACAVVARRVAADCGDLLGSSEWFDSRRMALDAAVASAASMPADESTRHIADPSPTVVHRCGTVLDDGFAQFATAPTGQSRALIDVGPSHGHLRFEFDYLTLDAKKNDNLRLYTSADMSNEVLHIMPKDLPLQVASIDITGSQALLLLVSDGAGSRTSLGVRVTCVCEDSTTFVDADGDGCAAYGDRSGVKYRRCASLLPPTDARARTACPLACGACTPDPCSTSPCQNGGSCAGGDGATCTADNVGSRTADVHTECCDEPTEDCSSGQPATCNVGCAAVLVPYYQDCRAALSADAEVLAAVESAVQMCAATPIYRCSCRKGWDGDNCEIQVLPTFTVRSGPCTTSSDGSCFRSPNYPDAYGSLQNCEIGVVSGAGFARATAFETESTYDYFSVDGVEYSGNGGTLAGSGVPISDTVSIAFHSDDSEQTGAVEVCGQACDGTACGQHGRCGIAGASCECRDGWSGAACDYPPLGSLTEGFEESYTVSGCSNPEHCGVFQRVPAHCTASSGSCPGGRFANGNTDPTLCDGAPVYQRQGDNGGDAGVILYRFFNGDDTVWYVGSSNALAYCSGSNYLESASAPAADPTAPSYSAGGGWYDDDGSGRGSITITPGGGQH